jgi:hypothetical protein
MQDILSFKTELTGKSRMMGDYHVRFCERVSCTCPTRPTKLNSITAARIKIKKSCR